MARRSKKAITKRNIYITVLTIIAFICVAYQNEIKSFMTEPLIENHTYTLNDLPKYNGQAYVQINNNWYAIDTTWDDPVAIGNAYISEEDRYENFLRGSNKFFTNHKEDGYLSPGSIKFKFPTLSKEDYNY